jgi:SH3 domain protein
MFKSRLKNLVLIALLSPLYIAAQTDDSSDDTSAMTTVDGYIKDDLFIYFHSGSSKKFKILGSIKAGTALQMLDANEETGYIQIKDDKGRTGWIEQSSYSTEPGNSINLQALQIKYDELVETTRFSETSMDDLIIQLKAANDTTEEQMQKIAILEKEKLNLQDEVSKNIDTQQQKQMIYGAAIIAVGILFGLLMPSLVRRRRRNEYL